MSEKMFQTRQNIETFRAFATNKTLGHFRVTEIEKDVILLEPRVSTESKSGKEIDLMVLGLTHGDEIIGAAILCEILRLVSIGWNPGPLKMALALANPAAALENKRFIEKDLNRVFGTVETETLESKRARTFEKLFNRTKFVIDLHQTESPSKSPFFISKFHLESLLAFRRIFPKLPVVTYFDSKISKAGMTTLNYHLSQGGSGFGIELGQKGLCPLQLELGVALIMKLADTSIFLQKLEGNPEDFEHVYTFNGTVSSSSGDYLMNSHLANFGEIKVGEHLGQIDGKEVFSDRDGMFVFLQTNPQTNAVQNHGPAEVLRYIKKVDLALHELKS